MDIFNRTCRSSGHHFIKNQISRQNQFELMHGIPLRSQQQFLVRCREVTQSERAKTSGYGGSVELHQFTFEAILKRSAQKLKQRMIYSSNVSTMCRIRLTFLYLKDIFILGAANYTTHSHFYMIFKT